MMLSDYKNLWSKFLGTPPIDQQFQLWMEMHNSSTIRHGILKADGKIGKPAGEPEEAEHGNQ